MKKIHKERLLKLADHLRNGKLGHRKFDFSVIHKNHADKNHCGSAGCAIGELPIVFGRHFSFKDEWSVVMKPNKKLCDFEAAKFFFGLTEDETYVLFGSSFHAAGFWGSPGHSYIITDAKLKNLTPKATRKQVAANIEKFVAWKEKQLA